MTMDANASKAGAADTPDAADAADAAEAAQAAETAEAAEGESRAEEDAGGWGSGGGAGGRQAGSGRGARPGPRLRAAGLLADAADRLASAGASGGDAAGASGGGGEHHRQRWSRPKRGAAAFIALCLAVVAVAAIGAAVDSGVRNDDAISAAAPSAGQPEAFPGGPGGDGTMSGTGDAGRSAADAAVAPPAYPVSPELSDPAAVGPEASAPAAGGAARPDGVEPRIVRTGSAVLEVRAGQVDAAVSRLSAAAAALRGYTSASDVSGTASTSDDAAQYATVTLRVPTESFDEMREGLAEIGTVRSSTLSSQDVTGEYVDLEARKRALEASRNTYLSLLAEAGTIGDTLAVQQQIDGIQIQIEQIEGQRQVLADGSDLGTLTVQVVEEGEAATEPEPEPSGIGGAFERSWDRFLGGLEWIIAAIGPVVLVALVLGAAYGALRAVRAIRRRRGSSSTSVPPSPSATP